MSDNTANAREPSMEDILASIRRIIDEEDTRDARPASDHVTPVENLEGATRKGALPVMAAASVSRDEADSRDDAGSATKSGSRDETRRDAGTRSDTEQARYDGRDEDDGLFDDIDERISGSGDTDDTLDAFDSLDDSDDDDNSVFPERESPFWSRATGRDGSKSVSDDKNSASDDKSKDDDDYAEAFDTEPARDSLSDDAGQDKLPGARPDIFTRAQNKLEGGQRLSTRERMQNLAARAEERAGTTLKDEVVAPGPGRISSDDAARTADSRRAASASVDAPLDDTDTLREDTNTLREDTKRVATRITTPDDADVLDLTNPMVDRKTDASDETPFTLGDEAKPEGDDRSEKDASGQGKTTPFATASKSAQSSSWMDDIGDSRDRSNDMDDVLDLTTPLGGLAAVDTGSVESGEAFHVSGVEEKDADEGGIEDMISRNLGQDDAGPEDGAGPEDEEPAGFGTLVGSRDLHKIRDTIDEKTTDKDTTDKIRQTIPPPRILSKIPIRASTASKRRPGKSKRTRSLRIKSPRTGSLRTRGLRTRSSKTRGRWIRNSCLG